MDWRCRAAIAVAQKLGDWLGIWLVLEWAHDMEWFDTPAPGRPGVTRRARRCRRPGCRVLTVY